MAGINVTPLISEGYTIATAKSLHWKTMDVPSVAGVTAYFLKGGEDVLNRIGYWNLRNAIPWRIGDYVHLYTAPTKHLWLLIKTDLWGCGAASQFQSSLLGLQLAHACLWDQVDEPLGKMYRRFQPILEQRCLVAFRPFDDAAAQANHVIASSASPFNRHAEIDPFYDELMQARDKFRRDKWDVIFDSISAAPVLTP